MSIFRKSVEKILFLLKLTKVTGSLYMSIFRKSVEKIQFLLKSD